MSDSAINLDRLSVTEQLRLLEELWERLRRSPEALPLSRAQQDELDRRLDELGDEVDGIPWDVLARRLRDQRP